MKRVCIAAVAAVLMSGCASPWVRIPLLVLAGGAKGAQEAGQRARDREAQSERDETTCVSRRHPDGSVKTVCR